MQQPKHSKSYTSVEAHLRENSKVLSIQQKQIVSIVGKPQKYHTHTTSDPLFGNKSQSISGKMIPSKSMRTSLHLSEQQQALQDQFTENFQLLQQHQDYDLRNQEEVQLTNQQDKAQDFTKFQITPPGLSSLELQAENFIQMKKLYFYYFKVKVISKQSPLNLVFKSQQNLKIYLSTEALFPSKFNSQFTVNAKAVKIHSEDGQTFLYSFVYFSVHSEDDQNVCILSHFGQQIKFNNIKYHRNVDSIINSQSEFSEKEFQRVTDKHNLIKHQKKDIIEYNRNIKQYLRPLIVRQNQRKLVITEQHQRQVYLRNKEIFMGKKTQMILDQNTNQCIRQYREYQQQMQIKKKVNQQYASKWVNILSLTFLALDLFNMIKKQRSVKLQSNFGFLMARIFCERQLFRLKQSGQTKEQRSLTASKIVFNNYVELFHEQSTDRAETIIASFLQVTSIQLNFLQSYLSTVEKIVMLQTRFRQVRRTKKINIEKLWKQLRNKIEETIYIIKQENLGVAVDEKSIKKFAKSQKFSIDMKVMGKIIDEFIHKKKLAWMDYYHQKKNQQLFMQLINTQTEPKLYEFSQKNELKQIIREYAEAKSII